MCDALARGSREGLSDKQPNGNLMGRLLGWRWGDFCPGFGLAHMDASPGLSLQLSCSPLLSFASTQL